MATVRALIRRALEEINVVAEGQDLSGRMVEKGEEAWQSMYAELDREDRAPFDYEDVPGKFLECLAIMLAYRVSNMFHVSEERRQSLFFDSWHPRNRDSAYNRYRRMMSSGTQDNDRPLSANYF